MQLEELQTHWDQFGKIDPLFAILTKSGKENNQWDLEEFFLQGKNEVDSLINHIRGMGLHLGNGTALDFGCGVGRLTQALSQYFREVRGVDIAPSMIALANKYNQHRDRCSYYLNKEDHLRLFESNTFDFIYSNITLQHMEPRFSQSYVEEFLRVLSPKGLLVFQLPEAPPFRPTKNYRASLKSRVPRKLISLYRKLRYGGLLPVMEMHGVEKSLVLNLVEQKQGVILQVRQEPSSLEGWVSNIYFVTK